MSRPEYLQLKFLQFLDLFFAWNFVIRSNQFRKSSEVPFREDKVANYSVLHSKKKY